MAWFSAKARVCKALPGQDFFDGRWDSFWRAEGGGAVAGFGRCKKAEIAIAGKPAPTFIAWWVADRFLAARTISCGDQDPGLNLIQ